VGRVTLQHKPEGLEMRTNRPSRSAAFTLVELLVVIVIIAILAGLLLPVINMARNSARRFQIASEITNLASAVEAYKLKYGDYPPDFSDPALVERHILTAWPNIASPPPAPPPASGDPAWRNYELRPTGIDPAEAVVLWLGGFSSDPRHPFTGNGGPLVSQHPSGLGPPYAYNLDRLAGSFEFDKSRFVNNDGDIYPEYPPPARRLPYVYFDSRTYGGIDPPVIPPPPETTPPTNGYYGSQAIGFAKPYLTNRFSQQSLYVPVNQRLFVNPGYVWANENTFQIISGGMDDNYGSDYFLQPLPWPFSSSGLNRRVRQYPVYPLGLNYAGFLPGVNDELNQLFGDDDNITNFSEGSRLKDMRP
jgi:prepilin-type N-terminal cleavage/methylation domain-containing protein